MVVHRPLTAGLPCGGVASFALVQSGLGLSAELGIGHGHAMLDNDRSPIIQGMVAHQQGYDKRPAILDDFAFYTSAKAAVFVAEMFLCGVNKIRHWDAPL